MPVVRSGSPAVSMPPVADLLDPGDPNRNRLNMIDISVIKCNATHIPSASPYMTGDLTALCDPAALLTMIVQDRCDLPRDSIVCSMH